MATNKENDYAWKPMKHPQWEQLDSHLQCNTKENVRIEIGATSSNVDRAIDLLEKLTLDELNEVTAWCNAEMLARIRTQKRDMLKEVEEVKIQLENDRKQIESTRNATKFSNEEERVTLNVRGTRFITLVLNLTTIPNTYFSRLIAQHVVPSEEIFIDRSPATFGRILDYLQGDRTVVDDLSMADLKRLEKEAEFYQLRGLLELCKSKERPCFEYVMGNIVLTDDNSVATKMRTNDWRSIVVGGEFPLSQKATIEQSVEIVRGNEVFIGIAPESIRYCPSPTPHLDCGWYFHAASGSLYSQAGDKGKAYHSVFSSGPIGAGSIVTIKLNANKEMTFNVNDVEHGIAFRLGNSIKENLFLVVILYGKNCSVRALS